MLYLVAEGRGTGVDDVVIGRLDELTDALTQEQRLIEELRQALVRQRTGVAADDAEAIDASVHAIGRTLLTLGAARRRRASLTALVAGRPGIGLAELEAEVGPLPAPLLAARNAVRRAAEATAREVAINQTVLRCALEAGDTFLQQLFSRTTDPMPMPVYVPGPRTPPRARSSAPPTR